MGDFIKKRQPFFKKDELIDFNKCKSEEDYIAWHMKHTPWFNDSINTILGKEDWERIRGAKEEKKDQE